MCQAEVVDQAAEAMCGLDRVEILPLEVLDERQLEALTVVEMTDDGRDPVETGRDGGANPSLPGDQLIPIERLGDEDRLKHAVFSDARRQARHLGIAEPASRLIRVRTDARDREVA